MRDHPPGEAMHTSTAGLCPELCQVCNATLRFVSCARYGKSFQIRPHPYLDCQCGHTSKSDHRGTFMVYVHTHDMD